MLAADKVRRCTTNRLTVSRLRFTKNPWDTIALKNLSTYSWTIAYTCVMVGGGLDFPVLQQNMEARLGGKKRVLAQGPKQACR